MHTLDSILDALDRHHQRATYGAVAGIVGGLARSVMKDRPKDRRHSWIVSKETGWPTGYPESAIHSDLLERGEVIDSTERLEEWLRAPA